MLILLCVEVLKDISAESDGEIKRTPSHPHPHPCRYSIIKEIFINEIIDTFEMRNVCTALLLISTTKK
jgi:hypothetical protein